MEISKLGIVLLLVFGGSFSCVGGANLFTVDPYGSAQPAETSCKFSSGLDSFVTLAAINPPEPLAPLTAPIEDLFERKYWYLVLLDTKEVFTAPLHWESREWLTLGGIAAGIGLVAAFDEDIEHAIQSHRNSAINGIFDSVEPLGNEYAIGVVGTFYIAGEIFKDPRAKATALDAISASAIASGLITNSIKYVVGRGRPADHRGAYDFEPFTGHDSFSSGHTTEAFVLASVIAEHYNSPLIQFTSYGLAGMVGYARLNHNRHWASDVLVGATVGTFVGKTVVHYNQRHRQMSLQPIVGPDMQGAQISVAW